MPNFVVHFEIPADDIARAKAFYEKTFGWTIKALPMPPGDEYFGVTTRKKGEPGIDGGMMARKMPGQPFMNYITVPSIDAMSEAVQANGGVIVLPKQDIGMGMGWIACFKDPENNIIGLHQMAPAPAKSVAARRSAAQAKRAPAKRAAAKAAPKKVQRAPKKKATAKKKRR